MNFGFSHIGQGKMCPNSKVRCTKFWNMKVCRLQCYMETFRKSFKLGQEFNDRRESTACWLQVDKSEGGF